MESPYHLSLLLYDYCVENNYIEQKDEQFYDKIFFKSLVFSLESEHDSMFKESPNRAQEIKASPNDQCLKIKSLTSELIEFLNLNEKACRIAHGSEKSISGSYSTCSFNDKLSVGSIGTLSISPNSVVDQLSGDTPELSSWTSKVLENLLIQNPQKAKSIFQLIFKYNRECQNVFLKGMSKELE